MSHSFPPIPDPNDSIALIREAVDRGVTFFDTAQVYGPFDNEELVGEALEPARDQVVIATKFGFELSTGQSRGTDSRPETIRSSVDDSLRLLRTDRDRLRPLQPAPQGLLDGDDLTGHAVRERRLPQHRAALH